jgi:hypothetical protein
MENEPYHYWRDVQRTQLGISANLFMIFASAIFGYVVNFLVTNRNTIDDCPKTTLSISLIFLLLSLLFYSLFTHNRLKDFRKTAKLYRANCPEPDIRDKTSELGNLTWNLYDFQRYSLIAGFGISLIGFCIYIYS